MTKRVLALCLLAGLALAACGGSSNNSADTTTATRTKNAALPATTVKPRSTPTTLAPRAVPTTVAKATTTTATKTTAAPTTLAPIAAPTTTPAATATTNSCTAQGPCKVGQTGPGGGVVFYVAATPQAWGQYMEVNPTAFEQIIPDTCNLSAYDTYAKGTLGDGLKQTNAVIAACAKDGKPAAANSYARVDAFKQNGLDDWFIPAKDELQALIDSKVVTFATDKDLTSGTWANKPTDASSRGFEVLYGLKKEVIAGTAAYSRGGTVRTVEIMSDGSQSYGNPNNRWGWVYIARAFGPKT